MLKPHSTTNLSEKVSHSDPGIIQLEVQFPYKPQLSKDINAFVSVVWNLRAQIQFLLYPFVPEMMEVLL